MTGLNQTMKQLLRLQHMMKIQRRDDLTGQLQRHDNTLGPVWSASITDACLSTWPVSVFPS